MLHLCQFFFVVKYDRNKNKSQKIIYYYIIINDYIEINLQCKQHAIISRYIIDLYPYIFCDLFINYFKDKTREKDKNYKLLFYCNLYK